MHNGKGRLNRDRHHTAGNGALLVVINENGSYWDRCVVDETILVALEHYGMPYRILDLALERPNFSTLSSCAGIILAQDHLGENLSRAETALIAEAVKDGTGLINFDNDLLLYQSPLHEMFGFDRINPNPFCTDLIRIPANNHYITELQTPSEYHTFDRMVTGTIIEKWGRGVLPLAEAILGKDQLIYSRHLVPWSAFEPRNYPILFATQYGMGKAVQFALNLRVWRNTFFGHARGIDDLFWRSILWTVRKPFVANMMPPFVTLSIDDCSGRQDFTYVDIARKHDFIPLIALFLKLVPQQLFPKIKSGLLSGEAHFTTHALDYYTPLTFNFGRGECTREELQGRFSFDDSWWKNVGATPGATIRSHWGEWGVKSLPLCKERGRVFFCPALQTGLRKADMCMLDGYWPFNLQTCYYDYLPDDHDFFAFAALLSRHQEDFLMGCTPNLRESDRTDIEKAARNAAGQIRHGLRGCFHAEIVTHEQKFDSLTLDEWDKILSQALNQTRAYEKIFASHDQIAHYLRGKRTVWIRESAVEGSHLHCILAGETTTPLRLSVFDDDEESVSRKYCRVDPFVGEASMG